MAKATQLNTYRGFQSLRGEYFALLEGDDYWTDPRKLVRQIGFLRENQEYVACAHYTMKVFDDDDRQPEHFLPFKAFNRDTATMYDLVAMNGVYHLSSIIYRNIFGQSPPQCLADPYSCEVTINMVYGQYGNFYCMDEYMSAYRVHGKGEFSTRSQEDIWLFHLHGFRRFFFYLGPAYYSIFSTVVPKFSRYVLRAPRTTGEVDSLKFSTRLLFALHAASFAALMILKLFDFRSPSVDVAGFKKLPGNRTGRYSGSVRDFDINSYIKKKGGKVYYYVITSMPIKVKKSILYIIRPVPGFIRLKRALFDYFVGYEKREK